MRFLPLSLCLMVSALPCAALAQTADNTLSPIGHIIVITLENHSFDNLFGQFPGAEGLENAKQTALQVDRDGAAFKTLPPVMNTTGYPATADTRFPDALPNTPFAIEAFAPAGDKTGDLVHRFYEEQDQIHGGAM